MKKPSQSKTLSINKDILVHTDTLSAHYTELNGKQTKQPLTIASNTTFNGSKVKTEKWIFDYNHRKNTQKDRNGSRVSTYCSSLCRLLGFQLSRITKMEATGEPKIGSLLDKIQPPRLEDAGLEDCALPPDSIQEAFLKAATAVRSRIFHSSDDESEEDCINDPWPTIGSSGDKLVGITTDSDPPGACAPKKGGELPEVAGDEVVTGGREGVPDKVVEPEVPDEAEKSCVDGLQGLKIGEKKDNGEIEGKKSETDKESKKDEEEEDDEKRPSLVEVCI